MIELSASDVVLVHQGGSCMFPCSSADQEQSVLAHVWGHLSADLQTRVSSLVAQFALNVVVVHPQNQPQEEEQRYVEPIPNAQNPS